MKVQVNPIAAIAGGVALIAVIVLLFTMRGKGPEANATQRNTQIMDQMRQTGATAGAPPTGTFQPPPDAMRMMQAGQNNGGGMGAPSGGMPAGGGMMPGGGGMGMPAGR